MSKRSGRGSLNLDHVFGEIVRERRTTLGLTQADLEGDGRFERSYVSKIELGQRRVTLDVILHIAAILQVSPGVLIDDWAARVKKAQSMEESKRNTQRPPQ